MPDTQGSPLGKFADSVRKQLHEHDIRLTKLETKNQFKATYMDWFWRIVGIILVAGSLFVAIMALINTR